MSRRSKWLEVLALCVAALLPVLPALLAGHTIGAFDQIRQMLPWQGPRPPEPWDVLQADSVLQFYGWRDLVLSSWARHQFPLWNTYELCGYPLLANSQSAPLYPPLMVLGLLGIPVHAATLFLAWAHLALAGIGTFRLARWLGAEPWAARFAAISFNLSPFLLSWTALSSVIFTCAWIPWTLGYLLALGNSKPNFWNFLGLSVTVALMLLAGHLQFAAFGLMALLVLGVGQLIQGKFKGSLFAVGAVVLGAVLASPQIVPVLEYSRLSHRKNVPTEHGFAAYQGAAIKPFELANLVHPFLLGNPRSFSSLEKPKISAYWPALTKPGANLAEAAVTVGPMCLLFMFLAPFRDRRLWGLAAVAVLAFMLATGSFVAAGLYFGVPGWSSTGSPGRAIVLVVLASCVLGALGLQRLREWLHQNPEWTPRAALGVVTVGVVSIGLSQLSSLDPSAKFLITEAYAAAIPSLLVVLALGVLGIVALGHKDAQAKEALPVLAVLSVAASGMLFGYIPHGKPLENPEVPPAGERIAITNSRWDLLTAQPALMPPNTATLFRIREMTGYDSLVPKETVDLFKNANGGQDPAAAANGNMMFWKPGAGPEALDAFGVSQVWTPIRDPATGAWSIQKQPVPNAKGRVVPNLATARITLDDPGHIELSTSGSGFVQVKERALPGWKVWVDGKESTLGPGPWLNVTMPAGDHAVVFRYEPESFTRQLRAVFGVILLLAMSAAFVWFQERRQLARS